MLTLVATILVVAVLYLGRAVFIPIALAILLSFLLGPLVNRLERWGVHRVLSVLVVTVMSFLAIGAIGYVVAAEALALADRLPAYKHNINEKVRAVAAPGIFSRASEKVREVTEEAIKATTQAEDDLTSPPATQSQISADAAGALEVEPAATQPAAPVLVQVHEPAPNAFESLWGVVAPILGPLGQAGLVVVFVIFMLIQREDLRDRVIALIGPNQITLTTQVLDDAAERVSRYLLMQFVVNATYGIPVAIGLWSIGVPNYLLWGVLCFVFRYIPYVGPWLGASLPVIISLAVFDGWTQPLLVIGLFIVLELISNNVVEPVLYGRGTGLTPVAVLASAVFWTWLWGVPGLVLATPITVCIVVIGRYLPNMQWLAVLLGDTPALPLPARVYQRLLAMDHDEVFDLARDYLKEYSLTQWYDDVLMPALVLAEHDRHQGTLEDPRAQGVYRSVRSLIEELGEEAIAAKDERTSDEEPSKAGQTPTPESRNFSSSSAEKSLIVLAAARDEADELAALMLGQLLQQERLRVEVLPRMLVGESSDRAAELQPEVMCISAMPPMAVTHARHLCKRLRERLPKTRLMVGVWHASDAQRAAHRITSCGAEVVVRTLSEAVEKLRT